ncbi:3-phenylpropionate/trans-cinnamate dioxygenase ferredoxin reductase subunit [Lentzea albidocapillata subsp. violacea]|uniref:3-phenylpropionate/trans-cinnamate dioxygenase ferredoxin reductase subunit n=1 Tax=Lentzea albidocapillata subsp. violacea TaxID=128104 RepID=A0A1G8QDI4_9PSEU|nr:FAD-dependent oxidoreductase [Lentzea albidocapillata]SDJ02844.1 3-phenylpropionate/trans-cinnamate dioxygenase ferredoxin reductase subunit [Lentzea albidocapillata subsp. violacea]
MRTVAVVGASLAGLRSVQELRNQGFDGRIVVIGEEVHAPYDRPPLSKAFLSGKLPAEELALAEQSDIDEWAAEWRLGVRAERVDPATGEIHLSTGSVIRADGLVIATGGRPRTLPGTAALTGVHALRTLDDAVALQADLRPGTQVVVVGAGWIGAEVASTCRSLGLEVTAVEAAAVPMERALGPMLGALCADLHADHGVDLRLGVGVDSFTHNGSRVTGVALHDGSHLPADVVVAGIGMEPATDWLRGSGLPLDNGVLCDSGCVTPIPSVVAVGDVARYRTPDGRHVRHEHWTNASEQPVVAMRNLLAGATLDTFRPSGYVWSDQYGVRLQLAGDTSGADEITVIDGSPDDRKFVAEFRRAGHPIGVLAMNNAKLFGRMRRQLAAGEPH